MRINKYLALKKISTRRGADELIKNKKVFINGKLAVLGSQVEEMDEVEVRGMKAKKYSYLAYNKPKGVITHSAQEGEKDIKGNANFPDDVFPIGRLDKASHGLIILTNDGRVTNQLLSPENYHEKEYLVRTLNKLRSNFKEKMEAGVNIDGYITRKCKVEIIDKFNFRVILTEGKKHQIRRMCSALKQEVADLKRERVMNIKLNRLPQNSYRKITGKELEAFLKSIDLA